MNCWHGYGRQPLFDQWPERLQGQRQLRPHSFRQLRRKLAERPGPVQPPPRRRPLLQLPSLTQGGHHLARLCRHQRRPAVVDLGWPLEVEAQLNYSPRGLGLQLEVNPRVAVVQLQDRPHDLPLRRREAGR